MTSLWILPFASTYWKRSCRRSATAFTSAFGNAIGRVAVLSRFSVHGHPLISLRSAIAERRVWLCQSPSFLQLYRFASDNSRSIM